jgi:S-adenosylmethionine/arginine decarboxylase-like enzyme
MALKRIEHHHMLLRLETQTCPKEEDIRKTEGLVHTIIRDIGMKQIDTPRVYYVNEPKYNEGVTAIVPIQTSHIAFHFWNTPDREILCCPESRCLLQFDLYTCGTLVPAQIAKVLAHLAQYRPTHAELTLLNRNTGLAIEKHVQWDSRKGPAWSTWLRRMRSGHATRRNRSRKN